MEAILNWYDSDTTQLWTTGHEAWVVRKEIHVEFYWGNHLRNVHLEEREGDGRITFTWSFGTYDVAGAGFTMLCSLLCVVFSLWILHTHWRVSYYYIYLPLDCGTVAIRKVVHSVVMERGFRSLFSIIVLSVAWRVYRLLQTGQHYRTK